MNGPNQALLQDLRHRERLSNLFSQNVDTNRPFQFQKCSQYFIRSHDETLPVIAMRGPQSGYTR